jgi:glycosyltransferase involved in cell wall biosynthesis
MDWSNRCAALIPCFNEAVNIGAVVAGIRNVLPAVIVIDDGSTDYTARVARQAGAKVLSFKQNSGKGAALRAGWEFARAQNFEWVLMLDGDGQHAVSDIPRFFSHAEKTGTRLIVGHRDFAGMPPIRRWVNRFMSRQISKMAGEAFPDSQCGFRLAELDTLLSLPMASEHFEIESEMLTVFAAARQKVEFVPVQTIYKNGASNISPLKDTLRWLRWRFGLSESIPSTLWKDAPAGFLPLPLTGRGTEGEG